jgi:glucitol operon activator protein
MTEAGSAIIFMLAVAWVVQFVFSYFQMRRYYKRIRELNKFGSVWIGMEGSAWKRRHYVALVVDKNNIIQKVEELKGWTVLAGFKPVKGLDGLPISEITDNTIELPVKGKLLLALRNAVKHIEDAAAKKALVEEQAVKEKLEQEKVKEEITCSY